MTYSEIVLSHLQTLPESVSDQVFDLVLFQEQKQVMAETLPLWQPGSAQGQIWIADDFDVPLEDFKDYP
jgi:predicted O-methyltransferase YrrM